MTQYIEAGSLEKDNLLFDKDVAERAEYYVFQSRDESGTFFPAFQIINLLSSLMKGKHHSRPLITGVLNEPIGKRERLVKSSAFLTHIDSNTAPDGAPLAFRYESPISYLLGGEVEEIVCASAKEPYVFNTMPNEQDNTMPIPVKTIIVKDITYQYKTSPVFDVYFVTDQVRMGTLFQLPHWAPGLEPNETRPRFIRATPITYLDRDNMIQTLTRSTYLETPRDLYKRVTTRGALSKEEFDVIMDFFNNYLTEASKLIIDNSYSHLTEAEELIDLLQQPLTGHIYSQHRINMVVEDTALLIKEKFGVTKTPIAVKSDDEAKTVDKGDTINTMKETDNKNELPCANCINEMLKNHDLELSDAQRLAIVGLMAMALNMKPEKED